MSKIENITTKAERLIDMIAIILCSAIAGFAFSAAIITLSATWTYTALVFAALTFATKWSMGLTHKGTGR